jgi:hypothetical protein
MACLAKGPKLSPQYHKKKKRKKERNWECSSPVRGGPPRTEKGLLCGGLPGTPGMQMSTCVIVSNYTRMSPNRI